jgi:hypothetical protein
MATLGATSSATAYPPAEAFPVGSIYLAVVSTDPATLLGYGTWSAIGAGRVLVGLDSGDTDFDVVEETGGAKTVASAGSNAAEAAHTHTFTQVPNHVHVERAQGGTTASTTGTHLMTSAATGGSLRSAGQSTLDPTGATNPANTSAGSSHNHVVSWPAGVPTASGGGVDAHGVTNNAVTSAAGSSHNHAFTGTATSVVQPYFVCYMWKRTA